ncbi:single-stranded DNA-binding protein [Pseudobacillus badius]|uniref:single-stranded DNA-binding protein n=1 Tax=Bacillus badius TaxID=1455 RepID=UPI003D339DFB
MMNRAILVGRLTKDPLLRKTNNGVSVATFTLAVNRTFTNQQGERETDYINCVVWRRAAENVANFLKKGSLAGVDGQIQTRTYEDQHGRRVYVVEVVAESVQFLEPRTNPTKNQHENPPEERGGYQEDTPRYNTNNTSNYDDPFANEGTPIDIDDGDLPF